MSGSPEIRTRQVRWTWQRQDLSLGVDESGSGPSVLLLPALSSISTRREMRPLMRALANRFSVIAPDWPGFGDQARPPIAWTPHALSSFLEQFVREQAPGLHSTIAAGHAASYALYLAAGCPDILGRIVLLAPTWRGPLPTMVGGDRKLFRQIRQIVGFPVLGPLLYRLNVNPIVVRMMVAGHVYSDPRTLSAERIREKHQVIGAPGARFGSVAFVTGGLDLVHSRGEFLDMARHVRGQILVAYGAETPPKSRYEIEALAALPTGRSFIVERGKLGFYEEFAKQVLAGLEAFLLA